MNTLKIAIQKSGRLNEDSLKLLKDCGVSIDNGIDQLRVQARNFPLEIFFLRNSDIPQYVKDGVVDCAIIGENLLIENEMELPVLQKLGFSKCRLSVAVPKSSQYNSLNDFENKKIATSYPNTVLNFFKSKNINIEIHEISGSVEIAPSIGLSDAIVDIVSSGNTLFKNNLKEFETILKSEAILISSENLDFDKFSLLKKLQFRIESVLKARKSKYILMNVPNDKIEMVSNILPVLKSPTVMPLSESGWSSVHSVINEDTFWDIIEQLKAAGAEGILVLEIEKMIL
ncbi:ATP phosphoribosyltransferase [Empedobacter stercoris]|uniref:ATP phosphoribosyltransferase n=1 Tax=Empedobacter TaxID=59734 RepID=UPI0021AF55E0|nr:MULTISPECIES: ATP phosphoribosyltransferase [Empedobacter]MDM1522623.1 ATP phosphoribosyltransferase [Empedobacter sp. 225-1]MDM1543817.1 ATP phosphoribosyltransferase [Empedobacter sp. 189-2]UWX66451.1 ATP phosphoribosyltransferase [Empedobacter stercoris]